MNEILVEIIKFHIWKKWVMLDRFEVTEELGVLVIIHGG